MAIKTIPLSRLEADLEKMLNECAESGEALVVEMPGRRLLAIQPLRPGSDPPIGEHLASNPEIQASVAKSRPGTHNPFPSAEPRPANGALGPQFPPHIAVGSHVWTERGYAGHGPANGPTVNIAPKMGGIITGTEKLHYAVDETLYTVRWDNGQVSKHYANGLFCIGRFTTRAEYEAAIGFEGAIAVTLGPKGGFRGARMRLTYDGNFHDLELYEGDRRLWVDCLEPLATRKRVTVNTTSLPAKRSRRWR